MRSEVAFVIAYCFDLEQELGKSTSTRGCGGTNPERRVPEGVWKATTLTAARCARRTATGSGAAPFVVASAMCGRHTFSARRCRTPPPSDSSPTLLLATVLGRLTSTLHTFPATPHSSRATLPFSRFPNHGKFSVRDDWGMAVGGPPRSQNSCTHQSRRDSGTSATELRSNKINTSEACSHVMMEPTVKSHPLISQPLPRTRVIYPVAIPSMCAQKFGFIEIIFASDFHLVQVMCTSMHVRAHEMCRPEANINELVELTYCRLFAALRWQDYNIRGPG